MSRMNVYAETGEYDLTEPELAGWFDWSKASHWDDSDYNGNGSLGTGRGTGLYRTAQGRWVSETWSRWQGEPRHACTFTTPEQAREWLLRNDEDAAVAEHFGEIEEERGPGRPKVGEQVCFTVPAADLGIIDALVERDGSSRSAVLRRAVAAFVVSQDEPQAALDARALNSIAETLPLATMASSFKLSAIAHEIRETGRDVPQSRYDLLDKALDR